LIPTLWIARPPYASADSPVTCTFATFNEVAGGPVGVVRPQP
jgi:hypothetical protein